MKNKAKNEDSNEPTKVNTKNLTNRRAPRENHTAHESINQAESNDVVATKISRFARGFIIPENSMKKEKDISKSKLKKG